MSKPCPEKPRIIFDLTLAMQKCYKRPVGVLRTERGYGRYVLRHSPALVVFCRHDRRLGELVIVPEHQVQFILDAPDLLHNPPPRGGSLADRIGWAIRRLATWSRTVVVRCEARGLRFPPGRQRILREKADLSPRDVYVLVGAAIPDLAAARSLRDAHGVRLVVLCHDLIQVRFTELFSSPRACRAARRFTDDALADADLIVCNSRCTERDLIAYAEATGARRPPTRVVTLGSDISDPGHSIPADPAGRRDAPPFVLVVGSIEARKNQILLLRVWRRLCAAHSADAPRLVIAGRIGRRRGDDLVQAIRRDRSLRGRIRVMLRVSDAELAWLYHNCRFTVFPSHYEGWGLAVAESLAYGKYCIASSAGAVPEVTQGLVRHLDPEDDEAWRHEIERLWFDPDALVALERRIQAQYRPTTWQEAGAQLLACVREAASSDVAVASRDALPTPGATAGRSQSAGQATRT